MRDTQQETAVADFYSAYAKQSGISVEQLAALGKRAYRCDCGDAICDGWQMLSKREVEFDRARGISLYVDPDDQGYAPV